MAERFWIGGTGNWSDTAHWSTTSGGSGGSAAPTTSDNAHFDGNSGSNASVSITNGATCLALDMSGWDSLSALDFTNGFLLVINGSVTLPTVGSGFSPFKGASNSSQSIRLAGSGGTWTSNAKKTSAYISLNGGAWTFADIFNGTGFEFDVVGGTLTLGNNFTVGALKNSSAATIDFGSQTMTIDGYEGTIFQLASGSTIQNYASSTVHLTFAHVVGLSYPTVIDLNGKNVGDLVIDYAVGVNDSYASSHYVKFNSSGTLQQLDVGSGVFMKGVAGITLTITNCNIVGTCSLYCSYQSETASSNTNLAITNQNIVDTNLQDVNGSSAQIVVLYDQACPPTLTRVTNVVSKQKSTTTSNVAALACMLLI